MSYADTATALRRELSDLLVEAELSNLSLKDPLTTDESLLLQRYRASILTWVNRTTQTVVPADVSRADWQWGPARHFADQLNRIAVVTVALTPPAATLDLGTPHGSPTVERWRRAAAAATTGLDREIGPVTEDPDRVLRERHEDFDIALPPRDRQLGADYLDRLRVVDDNAALTHALILLDVRTGGRPGWQRLGGIKVPSPRRFVPAEGLLNALELCRRWTRAHNLPTTVDLRGHHSPPATVPGPIRPGMSGLHDAVHNTLVRLDARPRGDVMRLLLRSQAALSDGLVRTVGPDDPFHAALTVRRTHYLALVREAVNLGGRVGAGPESLVESETARGILPTVRSPHPDEVASVIGLLTSIDEAIAAHVRQGARETTYVVRDGRHLGLPRPDGIRPATDTWVPLDYRTAPELLRAAARLRPDAASPAPRPSPPEPSLAAGPARATFDETLADSTPHRTAATSPLARDPARTTLSREDHLQLRSADAITPEVREALEDYLLRRPHQGGGTPASKAHGREPSPAAMSAAAAHQLGDDGAIRPSHSGRAIQDRSLPTMPTPLPNLGPAR